MHYYLNLTDEFEFFIVGHFSFVFLICYFSIIILPFSLFDIIIINAELKFFVKCHVDMYQSLMISQMSLCLNVFHLPKPSLCFV